MNKPTWATVIGVFMLIFGFFGLIGDIKQIKVEGILSISDKISDNLQIESDSDSLGIAKLKEFLESSESTDQDSSYYVKGTLSETLKSLSHIPEATISKLVTHGYMGLLVNIFYLIAGFLLLKGHKKHVIKLVFSILAFSAIFAIYQVFDLKNSGLSPFMQMAFNFNLYFGIFFDVLLLLAMALVNKDYYVSQDLTMEDYYD